MADLRFRAYQYQHWPLAALQRRWRDADRLGFDVLWNCDTVVEPARRLMGGLRQEVGASCPGLLLVAATAARGIARVSRRRPARRGAGDPNGTWATFVGSCGRQLRPSAAIE
jgi:hypothetical protein